MLNNLLGWNNFKRATRWSNEDLIKVRLFME